MLLNIIGFLVSLFIMILLGYFAPKASGMARLVAFLMLLLDFGAFLVFLASLHVS